MPPAKNLPHDAPEPDEGSALETTDAPMLALRDGKPFLALSSPGGDTQDQQALQVFLNIAVFGMRPQQAIEAPRFNSLHHEWSFGRLCSATRMAVPACCKSRLSCRPASSQRCGS